MEGIALGEEENSVNWERGGKLQCAVGNILS